MEAPTSNSHSFFANTACEYFPCHEGVDPASFNCLFCYCPLYALGPRCGGAFHYDERGTKCCERCALPHERDAAARVAARFDDLKRLAGEGA